MPYIGRGLGPTGAFRILDDISGSFNGSTVTFALTVATASLTVGLPETLIIAVDGVIQEAGSAYTISGSNIVFGSAPQDAATFWGVELGDVGGIAKTVAAGAVDTTQIVDDAVTTAKILNLNVTNAKVATGIDAVKLADGSVTNAELQLINSLTENVQTRMNTNTTAIATKAAVGSGTPSTQTLPDTAATGSSTEAARLDHVHTMPAGGGGAITREGGRTDGSGTSNPSYQTGGIEATTDSTTLVHILISTTLSIGATVPITTRNLYRKTSGAAARAGFIISKINAIDISNDVGNDANNNVPATAGGGTNTDRAEVGYAYADLRPIITNYTFGSVLGHYSSARSGGGHQNGVHTRPAGTTADKPNATVDTITIGAQMGSGDITGGVDEFHVYSHAIS